MVASLISTTFSGAVSASGLTKFGPGTLQLTGTNVGLNGTLTLNQGVLSGSVAGLNARPITLNAGTLDLSTTAGRAFLNAITVNGDSTISGGAGNFPRIASLAVNSRTGDTATPVVLSITNGGLSVSGTTTLGGPVNLNLTGNANTILSGEVGGAGAITKWGGLTLVLNNAANNLTGPITINGGVVSSQNGVTGATPFGTAPITINPAGTLRVASPANVATNALTVNSDLAGIAVVSMIYNGAAGVPAPASSVFNSTNLGGPFTAVLAVDAVGFSGAIDLSAAGFGQGRAFLGSSLIGNFTGPLTASTTGNRVPDRNGGAPAVSGNGVYRLGGGGATLNFLGSSNQLTGANDIQIGAINNVTGGASNILVAGGGTVQLFNANNPTGNTYLNFGGFLSAGNNGAIGASKIVFNGGGIQADASTGLPTLAVPRTLTNAIGFTGDATFAGATNLILSGNVALADGQT